MNFESHARRFVPQRETRRRPRNVRWLALVGAAAIAAGAARVLLPESVGTRRKGGPSIGYFVKRGDRVHRGDSATLLHAGDLVRFTYSSEDDRYFALFNRDARSATVYYPSGASAVRVAAGSRVLLELASGGTLPVRRNMRDILRSGRRSASARITERRCPAR